MVSSPLAPGPVDIGGRDVPGGVASMQNLRILRGFVEAFDFKEGDRRSVRMPNVGYVKGLRLFLRANLVVAGGTFTPGDPRRLFGMSTTTFNGSTRPHDLDGRAENIFNALDQPVVSPKITFPSGTGLAAGTYPVFVEITPQYVISETNLLGCLYNGGNSTYMTHDIQMGRLTDVLTLAGGATAQLTNARVDVWMEWIDEVEPIPPREAVDAQGKPYQIPGQGLWRETSMIKYQQLHNTLELVAPGQPFDIDIPRGPVYNRIVAVVYAGTQALDVNDTLMDQFRLVSQQIATIREEDQITLDQDYRVTYLKNRPGGVYVMTFLDKTGSDRDLLYSGGLGRLQVKGKLRDGVAPPAGSRLHIYTETLVALQQNAAY